MINIASFNLLDIIFILIIFIFGIRGIIKGAISELISLSILVFSILGSVFLRKPIAAFLGKFFEIKMIANINPAEIAAVLLIFIFIYAILRFFERRIYDFLANINLLNLDKALGFFLGLIEGVCICFLIVFLLTHQLFFDFTNLIEESKIASIIIKILPSTDVYLEFFKNKSTGE